MEWERLSQREKDELLETAKKFIQSGLYVGFEIEELARMLCDKRYENS